MRVLFSSAVICVALAIWSQSGRTQPDRDFVAIFIECREVSCRVILEQPVHWSVTEHQAVLETVQESLEAFIAARRQHFEPVFMITAYYQETETSHIKAFLRRTGHAGGATR
jgi:hypothetical protein